MGRPRDQYVIEVAATCNDLFAAGQTDISAVDIAEAHFPGKALGKEIIKGVRDRLGKIRDVLAADDHPVCLLSDTYFTRFRNAPPTTRTDARRCLPTGYGKSAAGIHLNVKADDLIYEEAIAVGLASGAGKVKAATDRAMTAMVGGRLTEEYAGELLTDTAHRFAPEHPELAERVTTKILPTSDES
jgi:hypothetical protein